ncbi:MAG: VOC family protein [Chloroflexi bacterium]|nr:VOC family protein [Chloroflexota bacterium]
MNNPKITPHLWFDNNAVQAAEFYVSAFGASRMASKGLLRDTPSGDTDTVAFELRGQPFMAISAGPLFKFNPAVSFMVNFDPSRDAAAKSRLDGLWAQLSEGGSVLMPLDAYPFSQRYGWVQDRFGLSWQLILTNPDGEPRPDIIPALMFTQSVAGRAEEAMDLYCSVFGDGQRGTTARYPAGMAAEREGTIMFADFFAGGMWLAAMDSARPHDFAFNEAVSLLISCESQAEIDYYWYKLAADPNQGQCGWLKDKFGLSWQVWPTALGKMLGSGTPEQVARVSTAFLAMKKFDLAALEAAFQGR